MVYSARDICETYEALGVRQGAVVYVTSDLVPLMMFEDRTRGAVLEAHYNALLSLLGPTGTLVVSSASTNLCNTEVPFDHANTPSYQVGQLSEFVRQQPETRRSFHPFVSYSAVGKHAREITEDVSRHAYGPMTPEARMIEMGALSVSVGLHPRHSCSTVHHVEQDVTVPYRYTKEFMHPVVRNGEVKVEPFYLYVWYRNCGIERSNTKWIFQHLDKTDLISTRTLGAGSVYSYAMPEFVSKSTRLMIDDYYIWCMRPPEIRPWQS